MRHTDHSSLLADETTVGFKIATDVAAAKPNFGPSRSPVVPQPVALGGGADLFAVPPPLPTPTVARRERRKLRRQAQSERLESLLVAGVSSKRVYEQVFGAKDSGFFDDEGERVAALDPSEGTVSETDKADRRLEGREHGKDAA